MHTPIFTSNRSPEKWTDVVGNHGMMTAILDRLKNQQKIFKD
ncbi:ATP-binding protein [Terribacillus aidingensis]